MIVYRIAAESYKDDISGNGAALYGARWNSIGNRCVYTSEHISLAMLETLVHLTIKKFPVLYLVKIEIQASLESSCLVLNKLKTGWKQEIDYTQWLGDEFLKNKDYLLLKVPSAVVPEENNYLINPLHKDFKKIKISSTEKIELDKRLKMA